MFGIFGVDVSAKFIFTICLEISVLIDIRGLILFIVHFFILYYIITLNS